MSLYSGISFPVGFILKEEVVEMRSPSFLLISLVSLDL